MKKLLLLISVFSCSFLTAQTTYYLKKDGDNTKDGKSVANAFKTFSKVKAKVVAGDTVLIVGEYSNASYDEDFEYPTSGTDAEKASDEHLWHSENTIAITGLKGNSGSYITIKPYNDDTVLKGDGANILRIQNSEYLKIEGFEIEGNVENIPLASANKLQFVYIDKTNLSTGATVKEPNADDINFRNEDEEDADDGTAADNVVNEDDSYSTLTPADIVRPSWIDTRGVYVSGSQHIEFKDLNVHHTTGGGFRISNCNDVELSDSEIHNCSRRSFSGTHGLVVTKSKKTTSTSDIYSIKIVRNKIHHNYNEQYSWAPDKTIITPRIDEGKGISLQRNQLTDWTSSTSRILVANNICYWNGFSGVHSNDGNNIHILNNTCYMNSYTNTVTYGGDDDTQKGNNIGISFSDGKNIKIINNISVIDTDWNAFPISVKAYVSTDNIVIKNNLVHGIQVDETNSLTYDSDVTHTNRKTGTPLFYDAPESETDTTADFDLKADSPALGEADTDDDMDKDYDGTDRDDASDIGALESPEAPTSLVVAQSTTCTELTLTWDDESESEDGFKIQKSTGTGTGTNITYGSYEDVATVGEDITSYTVTGLSGSTSYKIKIVAYKDSIKSEGVESDAKSTATCSSSSSRFANTQTEGLTNNAIQEMNVYPNPTNGKITIRTGNTTGVSSQVSIYNNIGKLISAFTTNESNIDVNINGGLGMYLVKVTSGNDVKVKKIIKR